jgi:hypothetical protein
MTRRRVPFVCLSVTSSGGTTEAAAGRLHSVEPIDLHPPPVPPAVRLRITTPLRLRLSGDLVTGRSLTVEKLIGATLRRARLLGLEVPAPTLPSVRELARRQTWHDPRFGWLETTRFSSRQQVRMQLGGIVGEARLDLRATPDLWPLLWLASILHVGKGASMGFGRIELHAE